MPKATSERLSVVLKLARLREQQAVLKLANMQRDMQASKQQQQQLQQYKSEYNQHFKQRSSSGQSAAELANFQRFYAGLEQASETQQQRTVLADSQLQQARAEWQRLHGREKNIQTLIASKQQQEDRQRDNREQRLLDDRVISTESYK
jgi:flagellar export protein FliJ